MRFSIYYALKSVRISEQTIVNTLRPTLYGLETWCVIFLFSHILNIL